MIYKYLDETTLQPVQERTLKFARIEDLNDPFENLPRARLPHEPIEDQIKRIQGLETTKKLLEGLSGDQADRLIREALEKSNAKFDGTKHNTQTTLNQIRIQKGTSDIIGILALTVSQKNSLMWSHYCNKHMGYVLGFDDSHDFFQGRPEASQHLCRLLPVVYSEERVELRTEMDEDASFESFFHKSIDWKYEEEYRMLMPFRFCKEVAQGIHVIEYPVAVLKEVIFGFKCDPKTVEQIRECLKGEDVSYYRAVPSSISYDMEIESEEDYLTYLDD